MQTAASRTKLVATVLGTLGIMLWATETALITFTTTVPPLETVGLAFAFAALLSPIVWFATGDDPRAAFRQPPKVWVFTVGSLVAYHTCIYYATQKAPPAAAALLQGTTPLIIVLGSAFLPGERLRWWHSVGAGLGFAGILLLIGDGEGEAAAASADPVLYLGMIGVAAALWGLYSIVSRSFGDVPTSALGVFYAASAAVSLLFHAATESWVTPSPAEWAAIAALGVLPMGLALYLWDYGVKRGDIQALGSISYVEPFIGAALVAAVGHGSLTFSLVAAGCLVIAGAATASRGLLQREGNGKDADLAGPAPVVSERSAEDEMEEALLAIGLGILRYAEAKRMSSLTAREARELERLIGRTLDAWASLGPRDPIPALPRDGRPDRRKAA